MALLLVFPFIRSFEAHTEYHPGFVIYAKADIELNIDDIKVKGKIFLLSNYSWFYGNQEGAGTYIYVNIGSLA